MKKKGKTLMRVFSEEEENRRKKLNWPGDVLAHKKLSGLWVVVAAQMAGGESGGGMNGHDDWPDGHQIVLRKLDNNGQVIDWSVPEIRFYQSGCFTEENMLIDPIVVRKM